VITATAAKKISKESADYTNPAPGKDHCAICTYFERIDIHHCSKVEGIIKPPAWCRLFSPEK
jgi:hypothetical protein